MTLKLPMFLAVGLAFAASSIHAQAPDPYWTCVDPAGNKVTRDEPCREGERQVLTNDPAVPKKRPAKPRPAGEPVAESTAAFTNLPNSLARVANAGKDKDLRVLIPLALFSVFGVAGLALLRRRSATTAAAQQTREAPRHYVAAPGPTAAAAASPIGTHGWSVNLIRDLDAKRFENLVVGYWQAKGFQARVSRTAANGDDVLLYEPRTGGQLYAVAHCRALRDEQISVSLVRQLWGATQAHRVDNGLLYSLSAPTADAQAFLKKHKTLKLVTADALLTQVWTLSREQQAGLWVRIGR